MKLRGNVTKAVSDGNKFQVVIESSTADPETIGALSIMARSMRTVDIVIGMPEDRDEDGIDRVLIMRAAKDLAIGEQGLLRTRSDVAGWVRMTNTLGGMHNWTGGDIDRLGDEVDALLRLREGEK